MLETSENDLFDISEYGMLEINKNGNVGDK